MLHSYRDRPGSSRGLEKVVLRLLEEEQSAMSRTNFPRWKPRQYFDDEGAHWSCIPELVQVSFIFIDWVGVVSTNNISSITCTRQFKEYSWIGYYKTTSPSLMVRDLDLVKDMLIKDFSSFHANDMDFNNDEILAKNPFMLSGEEWKASR